jgi:hypothetical protein
MRKLFIFETRLWETGVEIIGRPTSRLVEIAQAQDCHFIAIWRMQTGGRPKGKRRAGGHCATVSPLPKVSQYLRNSARGLLYRHDCPRFKRKPVRQITGKTLRQIIRKVTGRATGHNFSPGGRICRFRNRNCGNANAAFLGLNSPEAASIP